MFDKQYRFTGTHARMVDELTAVFENELKTKLFEHNYDVYINAPLVGFLYQRKGKKNSEGDTSNQNIFPEQMIKFSDILIYIFRIIMILDEEHEPDREKRLDLAFRNLDNNESEIELFDQYVLGGVEVMHEKLIQDSHEPSDYVTHMYYFLEEFHERFNEKIGNEDILKLCDPRA